MKSARPPALPYASMPLYEPIFVARQPIFDLERRIWGYELLFRHSMDAVSAKIIDQDVATSKVIVDGFAIAGYGISRGKKMLINFPEGLLLSGAPLALPHASCVIEILEHVKITPAIIAACRKYKEAGYQLAIDDFVGQPGYEPLLEIADLVKVDVAAVSPPELIKLSQKLETYGCDLLAEKIETRQTYNLTRSLGFRFFQGYYFSRPEIVSGRKIPMENIARLRLLQELTKEDFRLPDLARIVSTDVSLSYRLLTYVNSAAFALRQKVSSLPQALAILGGDPFRQWLAAVVLSDLQPNPQSEEVVFTSIRRGRFLELQASLLDCRPYRADSLFLLGLFSQLDLLLGMEMRDILEKMPLDKELNGALCGCVNRPQRWLFLAKTIDQGDWLQVVKLLEEFGLHLHAEEVAARHQEATIWARNLLDFSQ